MKKDFDTWNNIKKITDEKSDNFGVHEREIWWVSFGVNIGVETDGKNHNFERPALILRKFNRQMVWILPITHQEKSEKFHARFLFENEIFFVALTQIRTMSTKRFLRKIGMLSETDFIKIKSKVIEFVQTNENPLLSGLSRRPKP
ncbi:MAG: type II toxin-antitoxin system PemK/MazF family toxin [Patescibacteria group bacterium]